MAKVRALSDILNEHAKKRKASKIPESLKNLAEGWDSKKNTYTSNGKVSSIDVNTASGVYHSGKIYSNPLHNFATYNTLFTLSGLGKDEIDNLAYLNQTYTPHEVIARTGGIGDPNIRWENYNKEEDKIRRDVREIWRSGNVQSVKVHDYGDSVNILAKGHDLFFENLNIVSTVGPNPERGLANFTKMEFELHEPFGVTFVEKVRASAFINGYWDYQDAPFLLTIQWKGTDESGRRLATELQGVGGLIRKIPILISRVQFDVDQGGARYQCVAVPYGDLAYDDRFKFPRCNLNISAKTLTAKVATGLGPGTGRLNKTNPHEQTNNIHREKFGTWVQQIESALKQQMDDEIEDGTRQWADEYKFVVSQEVLDFGREYFNDLTTVKAEETQSLFQKIIGSDNMPSIELNVAQGEIDFRTALPKFFEDAVRSLIGYQHLVDTFWYTYGATMLKKVHNTPTTNKTRVVDYLSNRNKMFEKDLEENQYIDWFMIKPHVVTHTEKPFDNIRKVHTKTITYYAIPTKIHILKFIKPGVSFGHINWDKYVRKQYDYIYTGDNVDVQSLKIDYKSAYYMRNVRPVQSTKVAKGKYEKFAEDFEKTLKKVFAGVDRYPEPALPLRQEPSLIRGKNTMSTVAGARSQEFYDYITNPQADMMKIELEILGDPAWISQDMYTTLHQEGKYWSKSLYNYTYDCFNVEQYQPLIKVNYRLPDEPEETKAVMFEKQLSYSESLFFNGVYQVTRVDSRFQNGEFTQVLTCVRLNNQKGHGAGVMLKKGDASGVLEGVFEDEERKSKINETLYDEHQWAIDNDYLKIEDGRVVWTGKQ